MPDEYACLRLENQLCFPLYVCSKEIVRRYRPFLDKLGITYTQYIVMMALWQHRSMTVKELGSMLFLDSGTLTPLLKKLEDKGLITRERNGSDERFLIVSVTDCGMELRERAKDIPEGMAACISMDSDDAAALRRILDRLMGSFSAD